MEVSGKKGSGIPPMRPSSYFLPGLGKRPRSYSLFHLSRRFLLAAWPCSEILSFPCSLLSHLKSDHILLRTSRECSTQMERDFSRPSLRPKEWTRGPSSLPVREEKWLGKKKFRPAIFPQRIPNNFRSISIKMRPGKIPYQNVYLIAPFGVVLNPLSTSSKDEFE